MVFLIFPFPFSLAHAHQAIQMFFILEYYKWNDIKARDGYFNFPIGTTKMDRLFFFFNG